ncbi:MULTISPECIES: aspartate ammonia-lyase [Comamonas]|jgi:aspartate ammonia-lyase|uniref:aspartate ammonia-lyase n=1 Tax=Comamonas TaxID=283 RepID=UPI0012C6BB66|nr:MULTISPECIES: aspartate ammonia-lyase [Comamonas]MDR3067299.1 aspartate ammonia-lyase [Comamonas sp.]MEB5966144.1 aspartate ammonia-lyase [Comamonas testosteroni]MPS96845.1 aspartate ammonia-lyase [Comamonas sp.]
MRQEHDFIGIKTIPPDAYWGVHSARAVENFPITGHSVAHMPELIRAFAFVKKAAAQANLQFGAINPQQATAISQACDDLIAGQLHEQFVVDVIQGGAGTSTNMNANEVIANRALEHLGLPKGRYDVIHPNDHVNASQSTNDSYPTAVKLATYAGIQKLLIAMAGLRAAFEAKAGEFAHILKIGRTQLQDAVPMTLGQEFNAFAAMIADDEKRLRESAYLMTEVNMGGTAIGTGINAPVGYTDAVVKALAEISRVPVVKAADLIAATGDTGAFADISGILKRIAVKLSKISNDLRLLSSGPQAGVADIKLPARQAGSSIMPGKVNPVIPEVMNQVCFEVIGNDAAITMAVEAGQLQLNAFEPLMAWALHKSLSHLSSACKTLQTHCVEGIVANEALLDSRIAESVTLVTALNPLIGYEKAARIAKAAIANGKQIAVVAEELGIMSQLDMNKLLVADKLTQAGALTAA